MAKTSIYLPDDLAEQARAYSVPMSEVAQNAVRLAVDEARTKENVMTDLQAVAERLAETRRVDADKAHAEDVRVKAKGSEWARRLATAAELSYVAGFDGSPATYHAPPSLFDLQFISRHPEWTGLPTGPGKERWECFRTGAREVWDAVQPLMVELSDQDTIVPTGSGGFTETVNPEYRLWLLREPAPEAAIAEHDSWSAEEPEEFL